MHTTMQSVERTLMGAIFDDPEVRIATAIEAGVTADLFTDPQTKSLWQAIQSLMKDREPSAIDFIQIFQEADRLYDSGECLAKVEYEYFDSSMRYLQGAKAEGRNLVAHYAALLKNEKAKKDLKASLESAKKALEDGGKVTDIAELVVAKTNRVLVENTAKTKESLADKIRKIQGKTIEAHESGACDDPNYVPGLAMPWPMVNYFTKGLKPGLHIIAGRPSEGKTSYMIECMLFWLSQGHKVAFNCLDMPTEEFLKRPICNLAKVSDDATSCGRYSEADKHRMDSAFSKLIQWAEDGSLMVENETSAERFAAWCRAKHSQGCLDVVVVDYVQLMSAAAGKDGTENDKITKVLAALKSFAVSAEIPVVVISQMTRCKDKGDPGIPTLDELRGSGSLEQDAMTVVFVYKDRKATLSSHLPDCYYKKSNGTIWDEPSTREPEVRNMITPIRWRLAKNQNGQRDVELPMVVYMGYYKWFVGDYETFYQQNGTGDLWQAYTRANVDLRQFEWPLTVLDRGGCLIASASRREKERLRYELPLNAGGETVATVGANGTAEADESDKALDDLMAEYESAGC